MKMFDIKSVCSIRTICGVVCLSLGLLLMQVPYTSAVLDQKVAVPQKRNGSAPNCTNVRTLLESRGINSDVPSAPINGKFCCLIIFTRFWFINSFLFEMSVWFSCRFKCSFHSYFYEFKLEYFIVVNVNP